MLANGLSDAGKYRYHTQLYLPFEKAAQLYAKKMKVKT